MEWEQIPEFPEYSVSDQGQVMNVETGRVLALTRNQHSVINVGLMRNGLQYKRSVALLVARAFLDPPSPETFDTPINLDGDRSNCTARNLMWRPRWFAVRYHKQFKKDLPPAVAYPIVDLKTGVQYKNSMEAATRHGLLDKEIFLSLLNRTYVWPTYQEFKAIKD